MRTANTRHVRLWAALILTLLLAAEGTRPSTPRQQVQSPPPATDAGRLVPLVVQSEALKSNRLGISTTQNVQVYVPAGYANASTRYPVLYLLHGIGGLSRDWTASGSNIQSLLNKMIHVETSTKTVRL